MQQEQLLYLNANSSITVEQARRELFELLSDGGGECPCCGASVKPYKVSLSSKMIRELNWLVKSSGAIVGKNIYPQDAAFIDFSKAPEDIRKSRTIGKLKLFGLAEKKLKMDHRGDEKEVQGHWRPTLKGIKFSLNMIRIQTRCIVFRNEVISMDGNPELAEEVARRGNEVQHEH